MAINSAWKHLIKSAGFILLSGLFTCPGSAQDWDLLSKQKLRLPVEIANTDRFGNIYLGDRRGNISKLDSMGNFVAQFAPPQYGKLTEMESWASLRVFLFYEDIQQYAFLDRYLNPSEFFEFPQGLFGMVAFATPSSNNQLWLLDLRPLGLTLFDINFNTISFNKSLNQLSDTIDFNPYQMTEYQNRVYLGDSDLGILVFDNLGNHLHTLKKCGSERFHLWREQIYYLYHNQLHLISIYQHEQRTIDLPKHQLPYRHILVSDDRIILLTDEEMLVYRYNPL